MALGIIPGVVLAWVDHVMTDRGLSLAVRVAVCGALGYPLTIAAGWWIGLHKTGMRSIDDNFYWGGLFGVIAAALCSWLVGRGSGGAMRILPCLVEASRLSSPRRRGPITTDLSIDHAVWVPALRGDDIGVCGARSAATRG